MTVKAISLPEGCPTLMPYLIIRRAAKALDFYKHGRLGFTRSPVVSFG